MEKDTQIMDYEKKYNEALERARQKIDAGLLTEDDLSYIFPELRESEDERMIRKIKSFLSAYDAYYFRNDEWREIEIWLEKQKELPLMDDNADLYFDEWNQQKQNPTKRQCFEEGMQYAQRLQKEQKPVEYLYKDKVYAIMKKLHDLSFSQNILINSKEYKQIDEITHDIRLLLDYPIEQKLVEWSEEDIKRLYSIGTQIGFLKGKYSEYQKDIDWLYALADKMGFHKCKT